MHTHKNTHDLNIKTWQTLFSNAQQLSEHRPTVLAVQHNRNMNEQQLCSAASAGPAAPIVNLTFIHTKTPKPKVWQATKQ